jgi:peptide deformylase
MAIRRILTYPDSSLKERALPVTNLNGALVESIDDMVQTMYAAPGVGLAAPQIGLNQRIVVLDIGDEEERGKHLLKIVNPEIAESEGEILWEEGCLSVVDFKAEVKRAAQVLVKGYDVDGNELAIEADDLLAVALQHEIDHLEGRLFIDRISRLKRELYAKRVKKALREGRPIGQGRAPSGGI